LSNPDFFWEKCFPLLFPYGRGGPSDPSATKIEFHKFVKRVLEMGPICCERRFQNNSSFLFAAYTTEMRRKIGGVCARVANLKPNISNLNDTEDVAAEDESEDFQDITVKDMTDVICYLNEPTSCQSSSGGRNVQRVLRRLTPFSESLKGSPLHMAFERKNLYAIIQSPVILDESVWRYFVTFAPSETYSQRLFDIVINYIIINNPYSEQDRLDLMNKKVLRDLSKDERLKILCQHPALSARLFDLQQKAFWDCVMIGCHKPLGNITDYWRRTEVSLLDEIFLLFLIVFTTVSKKRNSSHPCTCCC
jgi:hypothetical protein